MEVLFLQSSNVQLHFYKILWNSLDLLINLPIQFLPFGYILKMSEIVFS